QVLSEVFGFHPLAVRACTERNHIPRIHAYADHVMVVLNAPEPGTAGHVHLLELDQFIGRRYLVTVHGPLGVGVPLEAALRDTSGVLERLRAGRLHPESPFELSYAIVSALARGMAGLVRTLAATIAALERRILEQEHKDPEKILHELFQVRHELLTLRTMSGQSREIYGRMSVVARFVPAEARPFTEDLMDQFARVRSLCEDEQHFLQGVVEFYQTKLTTRINVAMERLALIAALVLPVTAVSGIYGMNLIVNERTQPAQIAVVLALMVGVVGAMLVWAKSHHWW
ncbi:MAG TPA: magnesium transporter CorA family protein, partial [Actinomycetota bacterium]|nr:magnesium transporter CorA family protein [Actinomycetota bacterium]